MNKSVYLDNSATSYPKPDVVVQSVYNYMNNIGANVNRSSHSNARNANMVVFETRELIKEFFNFKEEEANVIFTSGATFSLNQAIKGYLKPNSRVLVSALEHNAVMRPLKELEEDGLIVDIIPTNEYGIADIDKAIKMIESTTFDMIIISQASNVCGNIFPLEKVAQVAKTKDIPLVLDASQSAGHIDIDFESLNLSALCAPAHKGLLAPQGLGILLLKSDFASKLKPIITGGTGSFSNSEIQPDFLPDKFESGTPNIPAIFGLNASIKYILEQGIKNIRNREIMLMEKFTAMLHEINENGKHFKILGTDDLDNKLGVISLDFKDFDNAEFSSVLEEDYGIKTRCGLHCSPIAHKTLGTFPQGSVRFSLSYFTTVEDIEYTVQSIKEVLHG